MRGNGVLGCSTLPVNAAVWAELGIFSEYALKTEKDARRAKGAVSNTENGRVETANIARSAGWESGPRGKAY